MVKDLLSMTVALLIPASVMAQQVGLEAAAATITQDDYARRMWVIAHDSMQGRDTPSPGLDMTAAWIAGEFGRMGLRGGGEDGGFIQRYPLRSATIDASNSSFSGGGVELSFPHDLTPLRGGVLEGLATGGVVLISGTLSWEAALAEVSIGGKHAAVILPADSVALGRGAIRAIRASGALSILVATSAEDEEWADVPSGPPGPTLQKGWGEGGSVPAPVLRVRMSSLGRMVTGRGEGEGINLIPLRARGDGDVRIDEVPDLEVSLRIAVRSEDLTAPNVVAILDGSDAVLKDEYVVFSAHMDHVGMRTPDANGDSIFNGADDNASGTIAVVEIAEAMAALPVAPKRSVVFVIVSGEEKGLWGSEWFADHPSAPMDRFVANLNADMVGRNWPDTIVAIGMEHSDLGEMLNRVNGDHPELGMTAIDDIWPEERFYFRSDHVNFARKGVPILFFFNGTHDDYHGRDDEPDRIDADKAARVARLLFYLGVDIANAAERPRWDPESYARIVSGG